MQASVGEPAILHVGRGSEFDASGGDVAQIVDKSLSSHPKVGATIANLAGSSDIQSAHLAGRCNTVQS